MTADPLRSPDQYWDRLSGIVEAVLSLPAGERDGFLAASCGGDSALRAEVESLVAAHADAPRFLDAFYDDVVRPALAHADAGDATAAPTAAPFDVEDVAPGRRIRHFEVHERLGSGGTGVVHRGVDTLLAREVAIKFLSPRVSRDATARARLVREAQAASRLDDPHVCAIHAVEPTPDGGLCVVMAHCAGGTLRDRLRRGPIPTPAMLTVMEHVARGLASAHRAGIVHGDIKPANVGFGEQDVARLLDFGVAALAHEDASGGRALRGTLPYLAPELWDGAPPGTRSDVWALGVTFVELVTGRRPFAGADPATLAARIRTAPLPPLVRPDGSPIDDALDALIRRMLHRDPAERPADGDAVVAALASRATTPARPVAPAPERPRGSRRAAMVTGALGLAGLAGLAWTLGSSDPRAAVSPTRLEVARTTQPLSSVAVLPFTTRGRDDIAYLSDGLVDLLTPAFDATGLVRGIDPNSVIGAVAARRATITDSAAAQGVARAVRADRYVVGSVVESGASLVLRATLRRIDGREVGRAQATLAGTAALPVGIDSLVRSLIATELSAPGDTIAGIAAATTSSSRALRAYLDGERELRDARPADAVTAFRAAVAADSGFALAWYRLARAARWSDVEALSDTAAARAYALATTLPARQQSLVRAYRTLRVESPRRAERALARIVADYPTDVEAWMLLGEARFWDNPYHGRPIAEATPAFERVMALDMRNREVTVYLMELADQADRRGQLDTLFSMYFSPNSAGEQPGIRATYIALHGRRFPKAAPPRNAPDPREDASLARVALHRIGTGARDRGAAREFARVLADHPPTRVEGLLALASIAMADSGWAAANGWLRDVAVRAPEVAMERRAQFALVPGSGVPDDTLRAIRGALLARGGEAHAATGVLSPTEHEDVRRYLVGVSSARLGDARAVAGASAALARRAEGTSRVAAALAQAVMGHWALYTGDAARAEAAFAAAELDLPARVRAAHPVLAQHLDRLARAEALARLGRTEEARRWRQSVREGFGVTGMPYHAAPVRSARS
jgi:serine/threonine protein kinase